MGRLNEIEKKTLVIGIIGTIIVAIFILTLGYFSLKIERRSIIRDLDTYCDMVGIHKKSNGKDGWSDYRNIYYKECVK